MSWWSRLRRTNRSKRIDHPGNVEFAAAAHYPKPIGPALELSVVNTVRQIYSHPDLNTFGEIAELRVGDIPWECVQHGVVGPGQWTPILRQNSESVTHCIILGAPPLGGTVIAYGLPQANRVDQDRPSTGDYAVSNPTLQSSSL